jgi:hypothetical protein
LPTSLDSLLLRDKHVIVMCCLRQLGESSWLQAFPIFIQNLRQLKLITEHA